MINTGHVEGHFREIKVALPHFTLQTVSTIKYVEELLLSNLQVPMVFNRIIIILTMSTWMVLALPMDHLVTTSGPLPLRTVRRLQI